MKNTRPMRWGDARRRNSLAREVLEGLAILCFAVLIGLVFWLAVIGGECIVREATHEESR